MYYAIPEGHPDTPVLIEISESLAKERRPMGSDAARDVADSLLRSIDGAPEVDDYDVLMLDAEDRDIHVLLRRRSDGLLARASYIEGDDIGDDIHVFEHVSDENLEQTVTRLERWCQYNVERDDDSSETPLVSSLIPVEENDEIALANDILLLAPTLSMLEGLAGQIHTPLLRDAVTTALTSMKTAASRK